MRLDSRLDSICATRTTRFGKSFRVITHNHVPFKPTVAPLFSVYSNSIMSFESFLTKENFEGYEDPERYKKDWVPRLDKYRADLESAILPEYKITLPEPIEKLQKDQFNPLEYLYEKKLLSDEEKRITELSATELAKEIASGKLKSVTAFKAYARRATICHQFTNCALELFVDEGLERAQMLDEYFEKNGKVIGPLHGVPISLKEQMDYKDKITHGGWVGLLDRIPKKHGATIQILENLGAVFYVRTNQPQTLMHLDSNNNFVGTSRNPFNLGLSSGGSSSGEGSIVAFGGSSLGVGSDIGGSIRAPAAYSGCHGLRPTTRRVALLGGISSGAGQESVVPVAGPMARSLDDIDLFMKHYVNDGNPWQLDQWALPLPWRTVEPPKPESLTIAVMYDDGVVKPTPPIARGLKEVVAKLKNAGAKVIEFKPIRVQEAFDTVNKMYNCDGNYMQKKLLSASGEPLTKLTKWALNYGNGSKDIGVAENRKLNVIRDLLRQEYTDYLNANKVDFILGPAYNNVAPLPEAVYNWSYTALYNILDFPSLLFQTGMFQDPTVDKWGSEHSSYTYRSELEKLELSGYDPELFKGAPIALQLAGRRYFDEELVAAGKTILKVLDVDLLHK